MVDLSERASEFNTTGGDFGTGGKNICRQRVSHDVTMAEIASASGFSIGSLYQFFKGKEYLYSTMISEK